MSERNLRWNFFLNDYLDKSWWKAAVELSKRLMENILCICNIHVFTALDSNIKEVIIP